MLPSDVTRLAAVLLAAGDWPAASGWPTAAAIHDARSIIGLPAPTPAALGHRVALEAEGLRCVICNGRLDALLVGCPGSQVPARALLSNVLGLPFLAQHAAGAGAVASPPAP